MTNTEQHSIKYLPFLRTLRIVAKLAGWASVTLHTEGAVAYLSLSRPISTARLTITVYAIEDAIYYDRCVHTTGGSFTKTVDFKPVRGVIGRAYLISDITGQTLIDVHDADELAAICESHELAAIEYRWPYQIDDEAFPGSFHPMGKGLYAQDL